MSGPCAPYVPDQVDGFAVLHGDGQDDVSPAPFIDGLSLDADAPWFEQLADVGCGALRALGRDPEHAGLLHVAHAQRSAASRAYRPTGGQITLVAP